MGRVGAQPGPRSASGRAAAAEGQKRKVISQGGSMAGASATGVDHTPGQAGAPVRTPARRRRPAGRAEGRRFRSPPRAPSRPPPAACSGCASRRTSSPGRTWWRCGCPTCGKFAVGSGRRGETPAAGGAGVRRGVARQAAGGGWRQGGGGAAEGEGRPAARRRQQGHTAAQSRAGARGVGTRGRGAGALPLQGALGAGCSPTAGLQMQVLRPPLVSWLGCQPPNCWPN